MDHYTAFNVYETGIFHCVENTKQNVSDCESQPRPFNILQFIVRPSTHIINTHYAIAES